MWLRYGLRNSTLSALMPSETSSQISNATNGIEPPRGHISIKASKDGILKQVVPEYERLKNQYELLWDMPNNDGYIGLVAIMQKFVDQTISANTNYDPGKFEGGKVPMKILLKDLLTAYKLGVKTHVLPQHPRWRFRHTGRHQSRRQKTMVVPVAPVKFKSGAALQPSFCMHRLIKTSERLLMSYTTFSRTNNDQMKEPMFFGNPVNVSRYDQQKYGIFEKLIEKQLSFFWRPEEVDVSKDRIDFQQLPEHEKHIFISNLKYQTLLDSVQGRSPNVALLPIVSLPELETWIETWAFSETIHSRSYTHIVRNITNEPHKVFDDILLNERIIERADDVTRYYDDLINSVNLYHLCGVGTHVSRR